VIREIQKRIARLRELAERKQTILKSIEQQGRLTEELKDAILRADSPQRLEDLYLPFKPKKKTKASEARDRGLEPAALLSRLHGHQRSRIFPAVEYYRLSEIIKQSDVFVDLFSENIERHYSMSTRAVVALVHGVPLLHPRFTELGELIERYDAGWTASHQLDEFAIVEQALQEILSNPAVLERKRQNARDLATAEFNPVSEAAKLLPHL